MNRSLVAVLGTLLGLASLLVLLPSPSQQRYDADCVTPYGTRALHVVYGSPGGDPRRARPARRATRGPRSVN
jgi:hypothetical protein